jgi:hypothetical protein
VQRQLMNGPAQAPGVSSFPAEFSKRMPGDESSNRVGFVEMKPINGATFAADRRREGRTA